VFTATGPRTRTAPSELRHLPTPKTIIHRPEAAWEQPFAVIYEPYRGEDGYSARSVRRIPTGSSFAAMEIENRDGSRQIVMQSDRPDEEARAEWQAEANTGTQSIRQTGELPDTQSIRQTGELPGAQSIRQTGEQSGTQSARQTSERTSTRSASQSDTRTAMKSAAESNIQTDQQTYNISMSGHYSVISLDADNRLEYIYLGHGKSAGWNGYQVEAAGPAIAASVEFREDALIVSSSGEVSVRFPYQIADVKDRDGNAITVKSDAEVESGNESIDESGDDASDESGHRQRTAATPAGSVVTLPAGMEQKFYLIRQD